MKKIISMLLVLVCAFALFSCQSGNKLTELDEFLAVADAKEPTRITTLVSYTKGDTTLNARFVTEADGENAVVDYSYQRMALVEELADTPIVEKTGKVYLKDSKYYAGEKWDASAPVVIYPDFNFAEANFDSYIINEKKTQLVGTASGDKIAALLGTDVQVDGTATFTLTTNGTYLTGIEVMYTTTSGANVEIRTSYTYSPVSIEFPDAG